MPHRRPLTRENIRLAGPRTRRRRFFALCATLVNRSGRPTLRFPTDWPWADEFSAILDMLRALPVVSFDTG